MSNTSILLKTKKVNNVNFERVNSINDFNKNKIIEPSEDEKKEAKSILNEIYETVKNIQDKLPELIGANAGKSLYEFVGQKDDDNENKNEQTDNGNKKNGEMGAEDEEIKDFDNKKPENKEENDKLNEPKTLLQIIKNIIENKSEISEEVKSHLEYYEDYIINFNKDTKIFVDNVASGLGIKPESLYYKIDIDAELYKIKQLLKLDVDSKSDKLIDKIDELTKVINILNNHSKGADQNKQEIPKNKEEEKIIVDNDYEQEYKEKFSKFLIDVKQNDSFEDILKKIFLILEEYQNYAVSYANKLKILNNNGIDKLVLRAIEEEIEKQIGYLDKLFKIIKNSSKKTIKNTEELIEEINKIISENANLKDELKLNSIKIKKIEKDELEKTKNSSFQNNEMENLKNKIIEEKNERIKEKDERIEEKNKIIGERDKIIEEKDKVIKMKNEIIDENKLEIIKINKNNNNLNNILIRVNDKLDSIISNNGAQNYDFKKKTVEKISDISNFIDDIKKKNNENNQNKFELTSSKKRKPDDEFDLSKIEKFENALIEEKIEDEKIEEIKKDKNNFQIQKFNLDELRKAKKQGNNQIGNNGNFLDLVNSSEISLDDTGGKNITISNDDFKGFFTGRQGNDNSETIEEDDKEEIKEKKTLKMQNHKLEIKDLSRKLTNIHFDENKHLKPLYEKVFNKKNDTNAIYRNNSFLGAGSKKFNESEEETEKKNERSKKEMEILLNFKREVELDSIVRGLLDPIFLNCVQYGFNRLVIMSGIENIKLKNVLQSDKLSLEFANYVGCLYLKKIYEIAGISLETLEHKNTKFGTSNKLRFKINEIDKYEFIIFQSIIIDNQKLVLDNTRIRNALSNERTIKINSQIKGIKKTKVDNNIKTE